MKEIIEQMKDDILNGEELQYDYEIDGVFVTVLADDFPWVRILAGGCDWETYVGNEHYDGLSLDDTLDELAKFIKYESIKSAISKAIHDHGMKKNVDALCGWIATADYGSEVQICFYENEQQSFTKPRVRVTVNKCDLVDDEDGIITKVAEFFANY